MQEFVRAFVVACLIIMIEIAPDSLMRLIVMEEKWAKLAVIILAIILYFVFEQFGNRLRRLNVYRRKSDRVASFEGFWVANVLGGSSPFALSKIYYSRTANAWVHKGKEYNEAFEPTREWKLTSLHFNAQYGEWLFSGSWREIHKTGTVFLPGEWHDQLSIILVPDRPDQKSEGLTTIFIDDPFSVATPNHQVHAGRAQMLPLAGDLRANDDDERITEIERVTPADAQAVLRSRFGPPRERQSSP